jgi:hypothetical protein
MVHVLAELAAALAERMACKVLLAEARPLPPAVDALLNPLSGLEGNRWYRQPVEEGWHG